MKKTAKIDKRAAALFLLFLFLLACLIGGLYQHYRGRLHAEFDLLIKENLTAYGESQSREVRASIADLESMLGAIATMLDTSTADPEGPWLSEYLEEIGSRQARYKVTYLPIEQLQKGLLEPGARPDDHEIFRRLNQGEMVVSDVRLSKRLGNRYFFSIAAPVRRENRTIGVLRSVLEGETLLSTLQTGYLRESIQSELVKGDGTIIPVREGRPAEAASLFDRLDGWGAGQETIQAVHSALESDQSKTFQIRSRDGHSFFLSIVALGYNDWHIANITRSDDVSRHSSMILSYTLQTAGALMLLTALAGGVIFWAGNRQKQRLDLEHARYAMLSNFTDTVLFEYSYETDILEFTSNALGLLPLENLKVTGFSRRPAPDGIYPGDLPAHYLPRHKAPADGEACCIELRLRGLDGEYFWCGCQYRAVYGSHGLPVLLVGKLVDISGQKERELDLIERSETDPLTGLYNKATIESRIRRYLKRAGAHGFLMMIDVDNFKLVNDTCGHTAGDRALAAIGATLRGVFRGSDLLGRAGGDEFVALMVDTCDRQAARARAEQLLERLGELDVKGLSPGLLSGSIGIAAFPEDGANYHRLFSAADAAMYHSKQSGKGSYTFFCELRPDAGDVANPV